EPHFERALLALQGPAAAAVLTRFAAGIDRMPFMSAAELSIAGAPCTVTRSGYTGEDGFEISLAADHAVGVAERLLAAPEVAPIGVGYVDAAHSAEATALAVVVRDVARPAHVTPIPFVPTRYYRG